MFQSSVDFILKQIFKMGFKILGFLHQLHVILGADSGFLNIDGCQFGHKIRMQFTSLARWVSEVLDKFEIVIGCLRSSSNSCNLW